MVTRRRFLSSGAAAAASSLIGPMGAGAQAARFETALPIPELRDARAANGLIQLVAAPGRHAFLPGSPTRTLGFSAPCLGPVLRVRKGDEVQVSVENRLDRDTTAHWHGVHVPAAVDGGPHVVIRPASTWRPVLKIDQPETTAWYHAHPHYDSGRQVYMGLASLMIIEDGTGERLGLPRNYGIDDLPLILQDRQFDRSGALVYAAAGPSRMMGMRGDTLIVNGAFAPVARVPRGLVRLRLLNAANARNFDLRFSDGRSFQVIASDGGYLPAPVALQSLTIAPGERFEILVDFSSGQPALLETAADDRAMQPMGGGMMRGMAEMLGSSAGELMRFEVDASKPVAAKNVPGTLVTLAAPDAGRVAVRRNVSLDMGPTMMRGRGGARGMGGPPMGINGRAYDMQRIDFSPRLGSTEIWEVTPNMMTHPFHVHGVSFRVLSIGGKPPAPHLAGHKDTILLDAPGQLLMTFTQQATRDKPFMFHCHILEHEDGGMMGQYITV
ncbi:MAG TPA: multicopper oxidase domain-containing protein [Steroidobacteraceae bacterium]|nr:multicopper oxidase domain-containing protein [Steroidobacteraceae bacterium]